MFVASSATIPSATGYPACPECCGDKAHEHKHQRHENQHAEERVQNAPHLRRTEGFRQPLQRREEERNPDSATRKKQITTVQ
jgi:hypothetical protein